MSDVYTSTLELPEGAVAEHSVMIVSFFDSEGQMRYGVKTQGEAHLGSVLGLIELAKFHVMHDGLDPE